LPPGARRHRHGAYDAVVRLRLGRPDLRHYAGLFTVPAADAGSPVSVTFLGVSTLLIDGGDGAVLTDGYFSRPGLLQVGTRPLVSSPARVAGCLERAGIDQVAAVACVHSHFDHALDAPTVARRTGADLVGGRSTVRIGLGHGLPAGRIRQVADGDEVDLGGFRATFVASRHCPPDRFPGEIRRPVRSAARASAYRCGEAWSILLRHRRTDRGLLVQGSAGFVPGALAGQRADVAYLGVGQLGLRPVPEIEQYWAETVRTIGARRVVLIHWDDFFRPLDRPLVALPYAGDDLDVTLRVLTRLAAEDGVDLALPTVWRPEDPWA
jgi:L-ascorbate metabolism protein UlaG (beta-lactamase superfamily)